MAEPDKKVETPTPSTGSVGPVDVLAPVSEQQSSSRRGGPLLRARRNSREENEVPVARLSLTPEKTFSGRRMSNDRRLSSDSKRVAALNEKRSSNENRASLGRDGKRLSLQPPEAEDGEFGSRRGSLKKAREQRTLFEKACEEAKLKAKQKTGGMFHRFLDSHTVAELGHHSPHTKVIELDSATPPAKAFDELFTHNILSAPIFDHETKEYAGFLDVRDLVSSIVNAYRQQTTRNSTTTESIVLTLSEVRNQGMPVTLTYLARRNPFKPVKMSAKLTAVCAILAEPNTHRVPVVDDNGRCIRILSQSTVLQFMEEKKEELNNERHLTLDQVQLGFKHVVCIQSSETALAAFQKIDEYGLSGVGVVDRDGKLMGNTSARDIKAFVQDRGQLSLNQPILDYLSHIRQREVLRSDRHPSTSVRAHASLGKVIDLLGATQYHRVFIVDEDGKPIGVISITDILRFAISC